MHASMQETVLPTDVYLTVVDEIDELTCENCGEILMPDSEWTVDGEHYCESCYNQLFTICAECGEVALRDDCEQTEDRRGRTVYVHNSCVGEGSYVRCSNCGEVMHEERMQRSDMDDEWYCSSCYDEMYCHCNDCGDEMLRDECHDTEDGYFCDSCYDRYNARHTIHNYGFKPRPIFYATKDEQLKQATDMIPIRKHLGFENEINEGGLEGDNARQILEAACSEDGSFIYCKEDGSICDGFEIVSHPHTVDMWRERKPLLKAAFDKAVKMGYRSHDNSACGLHIHISNVALGNDGTEIRKTQRNMLLFIQKFKEQIKQLSRRKSYSQLESYAGFYDSILARYADRGITDIWEAAHRCGDRHKAVNITNDNTTEIRFFQGTLKVDTLIACIQWTSEFAEVCRSLGNEQMRDLTWSEFTEMITGKYPELDAYMQKRGLLSVGH